jgi:hypothetical protein
MQIHLLVENKMRPVPSNVKVLADYGEVIVVTNDESRSRVRGDHMIVEALPEAIKDWLRPFAGVWLGEGHPMEQRFAVAHIK